MLTDKTDEKNLKDPERKSSASYEAGERDMSVTLPYTKTNKLITALYMVTDIVEKEDPIRHRLRNLGVDILSDVHRLPRDAYNKITETVSFLNIASAMNLISEMNCSILKKEFLELNQCIKESTQTKPTWLEEFFKTSSPDKGRENSKGHTRIGVQKGSTLMKALSDKMGSEARPNTLGLASRTHHFDILKKQRRDDIISIIKNNGGNASIKDIKDKVQIISEKTLQRELMSMIKDGVLNKTGKKRWSRYLIGTSD